MPSFTYIFASLGESSNDKLEVILCFVSRRCCSLFLLAWGEGDEEDDATEGEREALALEELLEVMGDGALKESGGEDGEDLEDAEPGTLILAVWGGWFRGARGGAGRADEEDEDEDEDKDEDEEDK